MSLLCYPTNNWNSPNKDASRETQVKIISCWQQGVIYVGNSQGALQCSGRWMAVGAALDRLQVSGTEFSGRAEPPNKQKLPECVAMLGPFNGSWLERLHLSGTESNGRAKHSNMWQWMLKFSLISSLHFNCQPTPLFSLYISFFFYCTYFHAPKIQISISNEVSVCTIPGCNREFNSLQGLHTHQRTCATKQRERELNAEYEAQLEADRTAKAEGKTTFHALMLLSWLSATTANAPPRVHKRVWEDPVLRKQKDTVTPIFINSTYWFLLSLSSHWVNF